MTFATSYPESEQIIRLLVRKNETAAASLKVCADVVAAIVRAAPKDKQQQAFDTFMLKLDERLFRPRVSPSASADH